jgi:hypothetical protein
LIGPLDLNIFSAVHRAASDTCERPLVVVFQKICRQEQIISRVEVGVMLMGIDSSSKQATVADR